MSATDWALSQSRLLETLIRARRDIRRAIESNALDSKDATAILIELDALQTALLACLGLHR